MQLFEILLGLLLASGLLFFFQHILYPPPPRNEEEILLADIDNFNAKQNPAQTEDGFELPVLEIEEQKKQVEERIDHLKIYYQIKS